MTHKDYIKFAKMVYRFDEAGPTLTVDDLKLQLCKLFASDNPQFDSAIFLSACRTIIPEENNDR